MAIEPPISHFTLDALDRLIPSRYSDARTVLADIADGEEMLEDLILLEGATNERTQGEHHWTNRIQYVRMRLRHPKTHT